MPGDGEFTDPVAYSSPWGVVAVVLVLLVVAWYAGVTWWTRDRADSRRPGRIHLWRARRATFRDLDRVEAAFGAGEMPAREAHRAVSAAVRSFAAAVGPVDARALNLQQLRGALPQVAAVVEAVYPPAFQPDEDGDAGAVLGEVLRTARVTVGELGR